MSIYVYPSQIKVQDFKNLIKTITKSILNVSTHKLIHLLNLIIERWGNYFGIGNLKILYKLDHFIWKRVWRYLRRKYKKVSIKIIVNRYFQRTLNQVNNNAVPQLLLLSKQNSLVPTHFFCPSYKLIKSSYYIDEFIFVKYKLNIIKLRNKKNSVNI